MVELVLVTARTLLKEDSQHNQVNNIVAMVIKLIGSTMVEGQPFTIAIIKMAFTLMGLVTFSAVMLVFTVITQESFIMALLAFTMALGTFIIAKSIILAA